MARLYRDPTAPDAPDRYVVARTSEQVSALLAPTCAAWEGASAIAWGPDAFRTTFRALWTSEALVVRFDCRDVQPWWTMRERDARLWEEEVVEIFVDPSCTGTRYAEVEISPANLVCDLLVHTPWPSLAADIHWNWNGLQSHVVPCDPRLRPCGDWTALAVLPFAGLASLGHGAGVALPPQTGDAWRFNVFRIKRPGGKADPERDAVYAAWSVPDGPSFHVPEKFRRLVFNG